MIGVRRTMGIKERQERERAAVRHAILGAARELFVTDGYRNVSMRKIADRIEYSPAAIYSYFPSKDDIFFALAEEGFRLLAQFGMKAAEHSRRPLQAACARGLWAFYEFSKAHPGVFRADVHRSIGAQPQPGLPAVRVLPADDGGGRSRHSRVHRARAVLAAARPRRGAARALGRHARRRDDRPGAAARAR